MPSEILLRNYLGKMGAPKKKIFFKTLKNESKVLENESESDSEVVLLYNLTQT
jgi:hypothetical protein